LLVKTLEKSPPGDWLEFRQDRQRYRMAADRDDRAIGRHRIERHRLGGDAVAQQLV
jgi:hypothetical protein